MATLLAGLGSAAGSVGSALGSSLTGGGLDFSSVGSGLGSLLGSALQPDLQGIPGAGQAINGMVNSQPIPTTAATPNTQPGQTPAASAPNPLLSFLTPYTQGQQMGFSQLQSQLLGK